MRTVPKWVNKIHEADKVEFSSIHSICFNPDGSQLVVGAGEKVMVYDPNDGALLQILQAHKGPVHTVSYCADGRKFASGSADKNVIIWTSKMEGVLKYSHSEAIQCLSYNPVTYQLASCALSDFAFWSAEVKAVQKYRVVGRITCCCWTTQGQHLAIGLASGYVSIRDKGGDEIQRIGREAPVWAISCSESTLLITDWNDTLSFYNLQGQQVHKERSLGISPLSVNLLGELVLIGGIGGWAILTAEGVSIISTEQEWVWAVAPSPDSTYMAVACQDGTLWCYQTVFSTVHGLYRERYAYRENMTDVIIQHLTTGNKVRIKCHDRVQKIAIYKHRLAVQLPERVVIYEQGDVDGMLYKVKEKMPQKMECSLLVATSDALLLCQDTKLIVLGRKIPKSWTVPSPIRYVKVTSLYFEEVLLLGLLNGQIWLVEPKQNGSRLVLETPASVRCFDVSTSRTRLAVVDEHSVCRVYSLPLGELIYTEDNVSSVSWNSCCDELLCLSGGGLLSIKASSFPSSAQPISGTVVGFQSGRVFCLQSSAMQTVNVPLSHAVHQYVQHKMFAEAYAVACLGVTSGDWERLGIAALEELSLEIARKAFQRSENITFLNLIDNLQERLDSGEKRLIILGEVLAYCGRYSDAAKNFRVAGRDDRALDLYIDLRMFNKAQEYVGEGGGSAALARRRAEWARHVNDPRAAAEMYLAAGDIHKAIQIMAETGRKDMLLEMVRKLDKAASGSLRLVAEGLVTVGDTAAAADIYDKLGDYRRVAELAVSAGEWSKAFDLARAHAECRRDVYIPYAHRMARDNNFVDAQKAYYMAGETATALRVFGILVNNAIFEERFSDAGYLHHLLALQYLETAVNKSGREREDDLSRYHENDRLSCAYHAYDAVHKCCHEPFSLSQPDALLNAARFVLTLIAGTEIPLGISMFCLYLCLAKQSKTLKASSVARQVLDKILGLQIPQKFQESVELLILKTRAAGTPNTSESSFKDEEISALCWRCRKHAPPLCAIICPHCKHHMAHSYATYEVLPLVQFIPEEGISEKEALDLIEKTTVPETSDTKQNTEAAEILTFGGDDDFADPFLDKVDEEDETGVVICSRRALLDLNPASVLIVEGPTPLKKTFYRNMLPELPVVSCPHCYKLFYMEDYEIQLVTKGQCPFCRHSGSEDLDKNDEQSMIEDSPSTNPSSPIN